MRIQMLRTLVALAVFCCALVLYSGDAFAQRDLRIPGRTGDKSRPSEPTSEKQKDGDTGRAQAASSTPFSRFSQLPSELGSDAETLRSDFLAARTIYNKLNAEQFIAARLLEVYARPTNVGVTSQDLFRGLANKKSYRTTLKAKGLSDEQVDRLMRQLRQRMTALL